LITGGALVTATKRAGACPEPLKCWCQQLSGIANMAPAFHSKVMRRPASFHTLVEPRPSSTRIISSNSCRCGSSFLPGGISHT
jgi:hypothetical protein